MILNRQDAKNAKFIGSSCFAFLAPWRLGG